MLEKNIALHVVLAVQVELDVIHGQIKSLTGLE